MPLSAQGQQVLVRRIRHCDSNVVDSCKWYCSTLAILYINDILYLFDVENVGFCNFVIYTTINVKEKCSQFWKVLKASAQLLPVASWLIKQIPLVVPRRIATCNGTRPVSPQFMIQANLTTTNNTDK